MSKFFQPKFSVYWLLLFSLLIFFWEIIIGGKVFYYGDILMYLPFKTFFFKSLFSGVFPLWNPHILSGYPIFADITAANYYFPYFILLLIPGMTGMSLLVLLHIGLSLIFSFKLGRILKLSATSSIVSALIFSYSGLMVNYIADPSRFIVLCLLPLFYYCLAGLFISGKGKHLLLSAIVLSFQIFAGHVQYVLIEIIFSPVIYLLCKSATEKLKKSSVQLFLVLGIGILLSMVAILPSFEILPLSTRSDISQDLSVYRNFSLNPLSFIRFVLNDFFGVRNEGKAWGLMDTTGIGYIGFLPLLLVLINLKKIFTDSKTRILMIVCILSLLISLGTYLPFFRFFVEVIPIFRNFRNPMSFLAFYTFFMSILSGICLDKLNLSQNIKSKGKLLFLFFLIFSALALLIVNIANQVPYQLLLNISKIFHKNLSLFHTSAVDYQIAAFILTNLFVIFFFGFLFFKTGSKKTIVLLIFIDLFIFSKHALFTTGREVVNKSNEIANYLAEKEGRYLSTSEAVPYSGLYDYFGSLTFQPPFSKEGSKLTTTQLDEKLLKEIQLIPPDFSMQYGLFTVDGTVTYILKNYNNFFRGEAYNDIYKEISQINSLALVSRKDVTLTKIDLSKIDINDARFDDLGVRFIVTDRNVTLSHHRKLFEKDGIIVYENLNYQSRARMVDKDGNILEYPQIVDRNANTVEIKTGKKGDLILYDTYYPGWKVQIDGKDAEISPYLDTFRKVEVDKENATVIFSFQPEIFRAGLILSIVSYGSVLIGFIILTRLRPDLIGTSARFALRLSALFRFSGPLRREASPLRPSSNTASRKVVGASRKKQ